MAEADAVVTGAIRSFVRAAGKPRAVVVTAPAGAGKSGLVCRAVGEARKAKLRVAVASPTNEQAFELVRRLATEHGKTTVSFFGALSATLPDEIARMKNVASVDGAGANSAEVVVATLAKLGDAHCRGTLHAFDVMLIDEAYQADSSRYYAIGHVAPTHLLVGDGGQLSPFSTVADGDYWRGLPEDPLQTAVGVLLRNHADTQVFKLPISRRLDARAVPMARAFYPTIQFGAAVKQGTRHMRLGLAAKKPGTVDRALEVAADRGWAHLVLPEAATISADPEIIAAIVRLIQTMRARKSQVSCERFPDWRPPRVAVGVSHNDQKDQLRHALAEADCGDVTVDTANRLQGLEFDVVIAWHPLAGLLEADEFHLDAGRLCVLLTRHRHACIVVGRKGDEELVSGVPPKSPSYLGWDPEPILDGWSVHEEVFELLEPFRVEV